MSKPLTLTTPPAFQCYDCTGCGDCCRGRFAIIITKDDRERIETQGWENDPALHGQALFLERSGFHQLAHRPDGSCVFLDDAGRCRIHARFGEPAKPFACRLYPFRFVPLGNQIRLDVRFDCPAVASNHGKSITAYRSALIGMMEQALPSDVALLPTPPLFHGAQATWAQCCRITEAFDRLLADESLELTQKMLACVNLAALLRSRRIAELEGRKLSELLETVSAKLVESAGQDTLARVAPSGSDRVMFRQLVGVYARLDRLGERHSVVERFRETWRMLTGRGQVPLLRPDFPAVDFATLDESCGVLSTAAAEVIMRYYRLRFASMGFFGLSFYRRCYLDGMNALLLTYPMLLWVARVYARGAGRTAPDVADVERAIQVIDHQHGISPLLDLPSERHRFRQLCERSTLRSLIIWYGS